MTTNLYKIVTASLVTLFCVVGFAKAGEINTGYFGNVAIKGYDPVAYFTESKAVKGKPEIAHDWFGATWRFSSEEHKKMFSANPIQYAPQYGGHCADGVAYGDLTTNIDPEAWRIIENKLYLNYDHGAAWEIENLEGQLEKSVENWPKILSRLMGNEQ